jgi:hypothetical protein
VYWSKRSTWCITMNETIRFADLRELLLELGFQENRVRETHSCSRTLRLGRSSSTRLPTGRGRSPVHVSVTRSGR